MRELTYSFDDIKYALCSLNASESTMLCAALTESICIGTEVVLCTDGEASDENIQHYDDLINFAKKNQVRINVTSFDDANCKLAVLGKFSSETNGIISRTSNSIDLTQSLASIATSAVNVSQSTKFKLIFNKQEVTIDDSTNMIAVNVSDRFEKILYTINSIDSALNEFCLQLQVHDANKIRVLTFKRERINLITAFKTSFLFNEDLLHGKVAASLVKECAKDKNFSLVSKTVDMYQDLYTKLNISNIPNSVTSLIDVIKKQNQSSNINQIVDKDAAILHSATQMAKKGIDIDKIVENTPSLEIYDDKKDFKEKFKLINTNYENLSSFLKEQIDENPNIQSNSDAEIVISSKIDDVLNKYEESSSEKRSKLLLVRELFKVCKYFIPSMRAAEVLRTGNLKQKKQILSHQFKDANHSKSVSSPQQIKPVANTDFEILLSEIKSMIENIKATGLVSDDLNEKYAELNFVIEQDEEMIQKNYINGINGLTSLISKKIIQLLEVENQFSIHSKMEEKVDILNESQALMYDIDDLRSMGRGSSLHASNTSKTEFRQQVVDDYNISNDDNDYDYDNEELTKWQLDLN